MHFLIIGGSGRTGKTVISQALERKHTVTALVRKASSLTPVEGLTIVEGVLDSASIHSAINTTPTKPSAIIITLNSLRKSDSPFSAPISPPRMMTDATTAVLDNMKKNGIKRLIIMSSVGVGDSYSNLFCLTKLFLFKTNVRVAMDDHNALEEVVRKSDVEWTLVRPFQLEDEEVEKEVRVYGEQGEGAGLMPKISRGSVAAFIVRECVEKDVWVGKTPVISN